MSLMKDERKAKAFNLRSIARQDWTKAHGDLVSARDNELKAAQARHDAEELRKAIGSVQDQPIIAASLENDAKAQSAQAEVLQRTAAGEKSEAQRLDQQAARGWAEAEGLDPETHRQVAPPPAKPQLRPVNLP
jgi:hypothetical protein